MRNRATSGILHWKMAIFAGQGQVQFAGANYAPFEMTPRRSRIVNFTDEIVYFSNTPSIVQSFMRKFDDLWISTTEFADYANITGPLERSFPVYDIDPELNFPPDESYRNRALDAYAAEQQKIDVMMFRVTDEQPHQRDDRGRESRRAGPPHHGRNRIPQPVAPLALLQRRQDVEAPACRSASTAHQGINHAKAVLLHGTGHVDLRLVQLDVAVDRFAA